MDPTSLAVAIVAALLGAVRVVTLVRVRVNGPALLAVLVKLIKAGNVDRAIKLCSAAPNAVVCGAAKAGLLASGDKEHGTEIRKLTVIDAYTGEVKKRLRAAGRLALLGWAAGGLGLLAVVLGLTADPLTPLAAIIGGAAIFNSAFSWWTYSRLHRDARIVGDGMVEALLEIWARDGD